MKFWRKNSMANKKNFVKKPIPKLVFCGECGSKMRLTVGCYSLHYSCSKWPNCDGTHGAHPNGDPMGIPANKKVRELRETVYQQLNLIWNYKFKPERNQMYQWIKQNCKKEHIGEMNEAELKDLIKKVNKQVIDNYTAAIKKFRKRK